MEIPQTFQGISNYYTIPWQKSKKNILNLKRGGELWSFFLAFRDQRKESLKTKGGKYFRQKIPLLTTRKGINFRKIDIQIKYLSLGN
jgi:hypothetical protein